jgi:hypothetical protein
VDAIGTQRQRQGHVILDEEGHASGADRLQRRGIRRLRFAKSKGRGTAGTQSRIERRHKIRRHPRADQIGLAARQGRQGG